VQPERSAVRVESRPESRARPHAPRAGIRSSRARLARDVICGPISPAHSETGFHVDLAFASSGASASRRPARAKSPEGFALRDAGLDLEELVIELRRPATLRTASGPLRAPDGEKRVLKTRTDLWPLRANAHRLPCGTDTTSSSPPLDGESRSSRCMPGFTQSRGGPCIAIRVELRASSREFIHDSANSGSTPTPFDELSPGDGASGKASGR